MPASHGRRHRTRTCAVALLGAMVLAAPPAWSSGSQTLTASATILPRSECGFAGSDLRQVSFGGPSAAGAVRIRANLSLKCAGPGAVAAYFVSPTGGLRSASFPMDKAVIVRGTVRRADVASEAEGTNGGSVVLTIAP